MYMNVSWNLFGTFSMLYEVDFAVAFYSALSTINVTRSKCTIDDNDVHNRTIFFALSILSVFLRSVQHT